MTLPADYRIGCAGWSLPRNTQSAFGAGDSHLQRYATRLNAAEINSSFYRPHQAATYARWASCVPAAFRFSVKLPQTMTHAHRLAGCGALLDGFMEQVAGLGARLGCLLVQLPPSLTFDQHAAQTFFNALRGRHAGAVALEPRHASWFEPEAEAVLIAQRIARVLADPVRHQAGAVPGGWPGLVYLRLHGSPRMYYSSYDERTLAALAKRLQLAADAADELWCLFDNTASGAAVGNALDLDKRLRSPHQPSLAT